MNICKAVGYRSDVMIGGPIVRMKYILADIYIPSKCNKTWGYIFINIYGYWIPFHIIEYTSLKRKLSNAFQASEK